MAEILPFDTERDTRFLRTPPVNGEAERALLGAILLNNKAFDRVADFLQPEHFSDPVNCRIFMACAKLIGNGSQANPITLKTALERDDLVIAAGGMKYIAGLANSVVTVVNVADYGRIIHDLYVRRELINLGEEMVNRAFDGDLDDTAERQLDAAASQISDLMGSDTRSTAISLHKAAREVSARWDLHDKGQIAGLSTGLLDLDQDMGLLEDGDMIVLAGSPGAGKTSLAVTIAYNAAQQFKQLAGDAKPKRSLIFSSEMSYGELASRAMTTYTGIQGPRRRKKPLDSVDWTRVETWIQDIEALPLVIDDRGAPTLGYIKSRCRQEQRHGGVGLIVLDYLQIMGEEPGRKENRVDAVGFQARGLKAIARTFSCPVIVISSINRQNESRENKRPMMSDLRSSGDIEFAADVVAFCHREEYYLERNEPEPESKEHGIWSMRMGKAKNVAEVIVAKARHGTSGNVAKLRFDRSRTLFTDLSVPVDDGGWAGTLI